MRSLSGLNMGNGKPRPFLDTNVLFSGLHGSGPPSLILNWHASGAITAVISRLVLAELVRTLRNKQPHLLPSLEAFLRNAPPEMCSDPTITEVEQAERCISPNDAPILAAALRSGADCIVSGNTRHFTPDVARRTGIEIFTPAQYVAKLNLD